MKKILEFLKPVGGFFAGLYRTIFNAKDRLIQSIAARNLVRQKRRNLLLGVAIAVGMMVLVLINSFARGVTDLILNKMMVYAYGHIQISMTENGRVRQGVTRDRERVVKIIKSKVKDINRINQSVATFTRAIGNGKADNIVLVGIDTSRFKKEGFSGMNVMTGNIWDFTNKNIENPIMLYEEKAQDLNLKVGDTLKARLSTIYGQQQTARFQVIVILKSIGFMQSMASYVPLENMKEILGYKPWESGSIQIVLNHPGNGKTIRAANELFKALKPGQAVIKGVLSSGGHSENVSALGYYKKTDIIPEVTKPVSLLDVIKARRNARKKMAGLKHPVLRIKTIKQAMVTNKSPISPLSATNHAVKEPLEILSEQLQLKSGSFISTTNEKTVALTSTLADKLGVSTGSQVTLTYSNAFGGGNTILNYKVAAVFDPKGKLPDDTVLMHEKNLYATWFDNLPASEGMGMNVVATNSPLAGSIVKEWLLLRRSPSMDDWQKKLKIVTKAKWKGAVADIGTMYENFDMIVNMERAIDGIMVWLVAILFSVILIGVVNTLNMTIRERTREIGTIRSIGMQKEDVFNSFMLETSMLAFIACIGGLIAGFILMGLLQLLSFHPKNMFVMFLDQGHLHFVPSLWSIILFTLVITGLTALTGYIPSRRASKMSPASALRHYE